MGIVINNSYQIGLIDSVQIEIGAIIICSCEMELTTGWSLSNEITLSSYQMGLLIISFIVNKDNCLLVYVKWD